MRSIKYMVTFRDFQFIQNHMARRIAAMNKPAYAAALIGIVLCAVLLTMAVVINLSPYRAGLWVGEDIPYPLSFYLLLILLLVAAILCLVPAINLRRKMLRLQVSDDGPFLGETNMRIGEDGLVIERPMATSKYLWSAIQGVEVTSGGLILPLDNGIGLVIPRNAFAADSELHALSALILRQLEASRSATPS